MANAELMSRVELCETTLSSLNKRLIFASQNEARMLRERRQRIQRELAELRTLCLSQVPAVDGANQFQQV